MRPLDWLTLVVALAVAGIVGLQLSGVASQVSSSYYQQSAEWCQSHDGTLYNSNTIGRHGGLHCELASGKTVHMSQVMQAGYPADVSEVPSLRPWWSIGAMPLVLAGGLAVFGGVVIGYIQRFRVQYSREEMTE